MTSTSGPTATPVAGVRRPSMIRARDVADLTIASGYPCISVLMPTEPAARMLEVDVHRLQGLVADVDRHLQEGHVTGRARLLDTLGDLVRQAVGQPTDKGLALYVNLAVDRSFRLPVPVTERALVERSFATRVLVTALHRMPPHVLLVLHPACAHLYQAMDGGLKSVGQRDLFRGPGAVRPPSERGTGLDYAAEDITEGYLRDVDRMLKSYRDQHPSPLVLGGSPRLVDRFILVSRNLVRLAGRVPDAEAQTAIDLARVSTHVVDRYLKSRSDEALGDLRTALAARPQVVACGMAACWQAVHQGDPGMLLVEEGYVSPGRPEDYGVPSRRLDGRPDAVAVHDLVDDLMEAVIARGGQLALVGDGDLEGQGRVALIARSSVGVPRQGRRTTPG